MIREEKPIAQERTVQFDQDSFSYQCVNCGASMDGPGECKFCSTSYTFSIDSSLITYTCSSCGASLVSSTRGLGVCRFCGTDYGTEAMDSNTTYVRVKPKFPDRLMGGDIRDNEKEKRIESSFLDKLEKFYGNGSKDKDAFLSVFLQAVYSAKSYPVSFRRRFDPSTSVMDFIKKEGYAYTENQSNLVRALPEIIGDNSFWGTFVAISYGQKKEGLIELKEELELAFGFLIPLEESSGNSGSEGMTISQAKEMSGESFYKTEPSVFGRVVNMFRFGRRRN